MLILCHVRELECILVELFSIDLDVFDVEVLFRQLRLHFHSTLKVLLIERFTEHLHFVFYLFYFLIQHSLGEALFDIFRTILILILFDFTLLSLRVILINQLLTHKAIIPSVLNFTLYLG